MTDDLVRLRKDLLASDESGAALRRIGRYDIVREISRGGMGVVYEAFDPALRRRVALKVVTGGPGREALVRRLHQEAAAVARLRHPNIVSIYETGTFEESPGLQSQFIAMDYIEGGGQAATGEPGEALQDELAKRYNLARHDVANHLRYARTVLRRLLVDRVAEYLGPGEDPDGELSFLLSR